MEIDMAETWRLGSRSGVCCVCVRPGGRASSERGTEGDPRGAGVQERGIHLFSSMFDAHRLHIRHTYHFRTAGRHGPLVSGATPLRAPRLEIDEDTVDRIDGRDKTS